MAKKKISKKREFSLEDMPITKIKHCRGVTRWRPKKKKTGEPLSTFDQFIADPKRKAHFEKEYRKFLLSETLLEGMQKHNLTMQQLAEVSGVTLTIIQGLRSGKRTSITLSTLNRVLDAIGYEVTYTPKQR